MTEINHLGPYYDVSDMNDDILGDVVYNHCVFYAMIIDGLI